jgi:hypothetical protein
MVSRITIEISREDLKKLEQMTAGLLHQLISRLPFNVKIEPDPKSRPGQGNRGGD